MSGEQNDEIMEEFVDEEDIENPALALKKTREKLKKATEEKQEYLEGWQRSKADLVNFKRDEEVRSQHTKERTRASVAEELIPVLDSFEMALKHSASKETEVLYKQLLDTLKRLGVEQFGQVGEQFNPHKHEAVREVVTENPKEDHTIVSLERSGYAMGEHIIRPAHVSVGALQA